jgi:hypothetical protein
MIRLLAQDGILIDRRVAVAASCDPADRATAEEGIRLAYQAAGLSPPREIVWCGGPVEIASRIAAASSADAIGVNVKSRIHDEPYQRIGTLDEIRFTEAMIAARRIAAGSSAHLIVRHVQEAADQILFRVPVRVRHAIETWRGAPRRLPQDTFLEIAIGPDELAELTVNEYLSGSQGRDEAAPLRGLWLVAQSASWIAPYANVCWVAERPDILKTGADGRLHCVDGPALRYRDGWSCFAWKGEEVPAWMIEHPERITADAIDGEIDPVLRDTMIDIMTPERFIASGDPVCVSRDETGALWRRRWMHRGVSLGSWAAVEITNGTSEPDGSSKRFVLRVPSHFRFAHEAVAWVHGAAGVRSPKSGLKT